MFHRYAVWEAKKHKRQATAKKRRQIRETLFGGMRGALAPALEALGEDDGEAPLSRAEAAYRAALAEELEGLAVECESLEGGARAEFENRHLR